MWYPLCLSPAFFSPFVASLSLSLYPLLSCPLCLSRLLCCESCTLCLSVSGSCPLSLYICLALAPLSLSLFLAPSVSLSLSLSLPPSLPPSLYLSLSACLCVCLFVAFALSWHRKSCCLHEETDPDVKKSLQEALQSQPMHWSSCYLQCRRLGQAPWVAALVSMCVLRWAPAAVKRQRNQGIVVFGKMVWTCAHMVWK